MSKFKHDDLQYGKKSIFEIQNEDIRNPNEDEEVDIRNPNEEKKEEDIRNPNEGEGYSRNPNMTKKKIFEIQMKIFESKVTKKMSEDEEVKGEDDENTTRFIIDIVNSSSEIQIFYLSFRFMLQMNNTE